ncbi:ABC transporter ATP-binding protein [Clostridium gasigenes]|uniref:ABC transporter ATP-binding protein n=1 Tax=Clostridium gasigenes TaxID=94869 RepID=UPI0014384FFF|nr:ABC transporter ATP-binding protein [Clostridium gasigenes]NKF06115.1 ABC transporter ATP-binding protein [Clostridium gasigenes]QSW20006.1 ABC transporter ATP-binding protein [Clostridium gasigenes]
MLVLKNIVKKFNEVKVLNNINVEFNGGINFILGSSGSGKSTLLKLISGIDNEFDGEIFFKGESLKSFSKSQLDSYYYNSVGFIWQNFQLLNHLSVADNVKLVLELSNLSEDEKNKQVNIILTRLGIAKLAKKNVGKLSGGEKQRVAIARALVKNPDIIIADEPTGALDSKSSKVIMSALKKISKEKIVIVVTHDKSLVDNESNTFLLKGGQIEAISKSATEKIANVKKAVIKPKLSFLSAFSQGFKNFKGLGVKFVLTSLILVMSSYFLLLNFSGGIANEQSGIMDKLISEKGDRLRDISVPTEAISAGGTDGNKTPSGGKVDIKQDVSALIEKYMNDPRIEHFIVGQPVGEMTITIDGAKSNYEVENSGNYPSIDKLVYGAMPNQNKKEVAIPKIIVEKLKLKSEDVVGKKISIKGSEFDWSSGNPVEKPITINDLTIVGVVDTTVKFDDAKGGTFSFEPEDSFVYSMEVVKDIKKQLNSSTTNLSFEMRVKDVKDIIPVVEELNKLGITPMGQFESVKDILKISDTTSEQSNSVSIIIAIVAIVGSLAVTLINSYLRKSEYAIFKINGYSNKGLFKLSIVEYILASILSIIIFVVGSPAINKLSSIMFDMSASRSSSIMLGVIIILAQGIIMGIIAALIAGNTKVKNNLSTGDR